MRVLIVVGVLAVLAFNKAALAETAERVGTSAVCLTQSESSPTLGPGATEIQAITRAAQQPGARDPNTCDPNAPVRLPKASYEVIPMAQAQVMLLDPKRPGHDSLNAYLTRPPTGNPLLNGPSGPLKPDAEMDLITSGTYCSGWQPLGPVMRHGRLDATGPPQSWNRGGIAISSQGKITVCDMRTLPLPPRSPPPASRISRPKAQAAVQQRCGPDPGDPLAQFMGGGSLFLAGGKKISDTELARVQKLHALDQHEHRDVRHVIVAMRGGVPHLILTENLTLRKIQADLCASGFQDAVKFDGSGSSFVLRKHQYSGGGFACMAMKVWKK